MLTPALMSALTSTSMLTSMAMESTDRTDAESASHSIAETYSQGRKRRAAAMVRSLASAQSWQLVSGNLFEPSTDGKPLLAGSLAELEFADVPPYGVVWPPAAAERLGASLFCGRGLVVSALR